MGSIGDCCCCPLALEDLPTISITGYTGEGWALLNTQTCCYEQVFTNDNEEYTELCEQLLYENVEETSSMDIVGTVQTSFFQYIHGTPGPGNPLPTVATETGGQCDLNSTVGTLTETFNSITRFRIRNYYRVREIRVRISQGNVSCGSEESIRYVVQVSELVDRYHDIYRADWEEHTWAITEGTCQNFSAITGYPTATGGSDSGDPDSYSLVEESTVTQLDLVRTKVLETLPSTISFASSDTNPSECWDICSGFQDNTSSYDLTDPIDPGDSFIECEPITASIVTDAGTGGTSSTTVQMYQSCSGGNAGGTFYGTIPGDDVTCSGRPHSRLSISAGAVRGVKYAITRGSSQNMLALMVYDTGCGTRVTSGSCPSVPGYLEKSIMTYANGGGEISQTAFTQDYECDNEIDPCMLDFQAVTLNLS